MYAYPFSEGPMKPLDYRTRQLRLICSLLVLLGFGAITALPYLTEAAKLGKHEAHLRLALLYNGAGMKDKAALEYEQFLKKNPDYKDRKALEQYISDNKKP